MPNVTVGINFSYFPTLFNLNEGDIASGNSSKYILLYLMPWLQPRSARNWIQRVSKDISRLPGNRVFLNPMDEDSEAHIRGLCLPSQWCCSHSQILYKLISWYFKDFFFFKSRPQPVVPADQQCRSCVEQSAWHRAKAYPTYFPYPPKPMHTQT